jgi:hypothetical protein
MHADCTGIPLAMLLAHRCHVRVGIRAAVLNGRLAAERKSREHD